MSLKLPNTPFMEAVKEIVRIIDSTIPDAQFARIKGSLDVFVVGGAAVHAYTQYRISKDLDAVFSPPVVLRQQPVVSYENAGSRRMLNWDPNYMSVLALMHPDWQEDAMEAEKVGRVRVRVISPLDLAVSKVARFADNDRMDIQELASSGLLDADALEQRCREAFDYYVGDPTFIEYNIQDAMEIVKSCSPKPPKAP